MIRVGMIGFGNMASAHARVMEPLGARVRFTGFADIDIFRAQKAAARSPGAVAVTDYRDMLGHVDAVVIALPHDLHFAVGMECLKAGKHVLMEKPLALTEQECRSLIETDTSPKPVLMVGYVLHHDPLWIALGDYIRNETYGKVFHISIWAEQLTDTSRAAWLGQASRLGGGQLFSHGCHYIDLLLHWMGDPISGTHVGTNLGTPWMEREGTSNVTLKFKGGATAYLFGTWGARGSRLRYSVHVHCERGMLELDYGAGTITLHRDRPSGDLATEGPATNSEKWETPAPIILNQRTREATNPVLAQMKAFLECIERKQKPKISAQSAIRSLQVIWKLYQAEQENLVADLRGT